MILQFLMQADLQKKMPDSDEPGIFFFYWLSSPFMAATSAVVIIVRNGRISSPC
jgi:hypothetical protein